MTGRVQISLHGERAERFEEIQEELRDKLGYEPTRAETIGYLMMDGFDG